MIKIMKEKRAFFSITINRVSASSIGRVDVKRDEVEIMFTATVLLKSICVCVVYRLVYHQTQASLKHSHAFFPRYLLHLYHFLLLMYTTSIIRFIDLIITNDGNAKWWWVLRVSNQARISSRFLLVDIAFICTYKSRNFLYWIYLWLRFIGWIAETTKWGPTAVQTSDKSKEVTSRKASLSLHLTSGSVWQNLINTWKVFVVATCTLNTN